MIASVAAAGISASIGAVAFLSAPNDVDDKVQRADMLMYAVKAVGNNQIRLEVVH